MTPTPLPFTQFVVKVHSRCDLACDHCYVYEHADTSWRRRPKVIGDEVLNRIAERIGDHAAAHRLPAVRVVLHGGEPLLAGPDRLRHAAKALRAALPPGCALDLRIHTNGVQLDDAYCELFAEVGMRVGVSLDGDRAANDRHRRFADGRSSHPHVLRAVERLRRPAYRHLYAGLLCTVDIENDPDAVYRALAELDPPPSTSCCRTPPGRTGRNRPSTVRERRTRTGCWPCTGDGTPTAARSPSAPSNPSTGRCAGSPASPNRSAWNRPTSSSWRRTAASNRPTASRPPTTARRRRGTTSSRTASTRSRCTPA